MTRVEARAILDEDIHGWTPTMWATVYGHEEPMEILANARTTLDAVNNLTVLC